MTDGNIVHHSARRDGTPERGKRHQPAAKGQRPDRGKRPATPHGPPAVSNAKPARRQNVAISDQPRLPWGEGERLQKVLARAGVASRRVAEQMIAQGRVEVDGVIVTEQGRRIDPSRAVVRVDGVRVVVREDIAYLALHKPRGWHSTMADQQGRPCVGDIVAERVSAGQRLFHVGRLDADTEGLLLLTGDGELAHRLLHPSYDVAKTYLATVDGEVPRSLAKQLRAGIDLDDGPVAVDRFQVVEVASGKSLVKVVVHEGRKHIVRRLLAASGYPVRRLVRTGFGPISLGEQKPGAVRVLTRGEVSKLFEAVRL